MTYSGILFKKIDVSIACQRSIYDIYYVVDGGRSEFQSGFQALELRKKKIVRQLLIRMANYHRYRSEMIKYPLKGYSYGEIRPKPQRFFYFQKCGKNYVFFAACVKKKNSLKDSFYKELERKKEKYEKAFQKFISNCQ